MQKAEGVGREGEQCECVESQGSRDSRPLLVARPRGRAEKGRPERWALRAVPLEESYEEVLLGVGVKSGRSRARNLGVVCLSEVTEGGDVGWNLRSAEGSGSWRACGGACGCRASGDPVACAE